MPKSPDRVLRVPDVTPSQWTALRKLALDRETTLGALVATALPTAPTTRKVFTK